MSDITWDVRIDWNNDDDFSDVGENVTTYVCTGDGGDISVGMGRDTARAFSPVASGRAEFSLLNDDKRFSPENGSSPLSPNVLPARPTKIEATHSSTTYGMFHGFTALEEYDVDPVDKLAKVGCLDGLAKLQGLKVSTPLYQGITTGQAIGYILDAAGWPLAKRDLDEGATVIAHFWVEQGDPLDEMKKVVASEGSPALLTLGSNGSIVFRDRHHRINTSTSITSQATFSDSGSEPIFSAPFVYDHGWRDIVNSVSFEVAERKIQTTAEVWQTDDTYTISASSTETIEVQASEPFVNAVTPVLDTDYRVRSGSISSVSLSRTSGQSLVITFTAGGSGATIDQVRLRADPLPVSRTYKISASDTTSQGKYGVRSMPSDLEPVWANRHDAKAIAQLMVLQRANRLPIVTMTLDGGNNDTCITQQLSRDLSDRVTIVEAESALNDAFYLERIEHTISDAGARLTTRFFCEMVPPQPVKGFILGTDLLGTGVLGY